MLNIFLVLEHTIKNATFVSRCKALCTDGQQGTKISEDAMSISHPVSSRFEIRVVCASFLEENL